MDDSQLAGIEDNNLATRLFKYLPGNHKGRIARFYADSVTLSESGNKSVCDCWVCTSIAPCNLVGTIENLHLKGSLAAVDADLSLFFLSLFHNTLLPGKKGDGSLK